MSEETNQGIKLAVMENEYKNGGEYVPPKAMNK